MINNYNTGSWLFMQYLPKNYPPALIAALQALNIKILRIPGGSTANATNGIKGNPSYKNSQLSNFIEFCKIIGVVEVYYVCNLFQPGKLQTNLAAIHMLVSAGLKVTTELGNEIYQKPEYIGWTAKATGKIDITYANKYIVNATAHIDKIRLQYPGVKILIPVSRFGNLPTSIGSTWNKLMMDSFTNLQIDRYAYHFYVDPYDDNELVKLEKDLVLFDLPVDMTEVNMQQGYEGNWVNTELSQTPKHQQILTDIEILAARNHGNVFRHCLLGFNQNYYSKITYINNQLFINI